VFLDRRWPDFGAPDLEEALRELENRERRFGRVTA
jgi:undecaprenyl pyrophosphate synthase